jgi:hypothetical protein
MAKGHYIRFIFALASGSALCLESMPRLSGFDDSRFLFDAIRAPWLFVGEQTRTSPNMRAQRMSRHETLAES